MEFKNLLPNSQSGFRKGRSCHDNLANLLLYVDTYLSKNQETLAAFLDVKSAFDEVNSQLLIDKIAAIGCPLPMVQFIKFLTDERQVFTAHHSTPRNIYKGVPQGGVLSPLLYIIYVSSITDDLPESVVVSQFADDIAIYISLPSIKNMKGTIENAIKKINNNLESLGLTLSAQKTQLVHFHRRKKEPTATKIIINGETIKHSPEAKFLGVIFDQRLTFKSQLAKILLSSIKSLNIINFLKGT